MSTTMKTAGSKVSGQASTPVAESTPTEAASQDRRQEIELRAYYKWLATTGGTPCDENQMNEFWFSAEQEMSSDNSNS